MILVSQNSAGQGKLWDTSAYFLGNVSCRVAIPGDMLSTTGAIVWDKRLVLGQDWDRIGTPK